MLKGVIQKATQNASPSPFVDATYSDGSKNSEKGEDIRQCMGPRRHLSQMYATNYQMPFIREKAAANWKNLSPSPLNLPLATYDTVRVFY